MNKPIFDAEAQGRKGRNGFSSPCAPCAFAPLRQKNSPINPFVQVKKSPILS
jgi:hypothetical protein